jgi:hypothetical protein
MVKVKTENLSKGAKNLIEDLAELEHEQWIFWSKDIASKEKLSPERLERWKKLWIPYKDLTEEQKEQDRVWARKVLEVQYKSKKFKRRK